MQGIGGNSDIDRTGRNVLAGSRGRAIGVAGEGMSGDHEDASATARAGFTGSRSGARTMPPEISSIRAATRMDGPLWRNRSLRTPNTEMSPMRSARPASSISLVRIQSLSSMGGLPPAGGNGEGGAAALPTLGDALAVLCVDLIAVLPAQDRAAARERLANRLYEQARTRRSGPAAALLGAIANALMRLER